MEDVTRDPTFLGIASRFFPVATLMTELSGGFPRRETLCAQTDHQFDISLHKFAVYGLKVILGVP